MSQTRTPALAASSSTLQGGRLYSSEEQWIAGETARAVVEMSAYARKRTAPAPVLARVEADRAAIPGAAPSFKVVFSSGPVTVALEPYAWAPEAYRHIAHATLAGVFSQSREDDPELIQALLDLGPTALREQNLRASTRLAEDFSNPSRHESAALLQAAFALREASGSFFDVRRTLSRITAHLAVADALRGGLARTTQGRLAEAALLALVGRQRDAVRILDGLASAPGDGTRAWARALRMRATLDWRLMRDVKSASTLERLEQISAMARTTRTYAERDGDDDQAPDWGWRRMEKGFAVGEGHRFAMPTLMATYQEALQALGVEYDEKRPDLLVKALAREPNPSCLVRTGTSVQVQVIDDGLLTAFYERHLAYASDRALHFFGYMLDSKDRTGELTRLLNETLDGMPLLDVVRRRAAVDGVAYGASMHALAALAARDPSRLTFDNWARAARWPPTGVEQVPVLPFENTWYKTRFPSGTVYDPQRLELLWPQDNEVTRTIDGLHNLAPWAVDVVAKWVYVRCHGACTEQELVDLYGPLADYVTAFAVELAYTSGDRAPDRLRKVCDFDGGACWRLADWLLSRDRFAEAAASYEEYIRRADDRVAVSNSVRWLAQYYFEQHRVDDALRIASSAAETGSGGGWRTLAAHYYRTGKINEARQLYHDLLERYDAGEDLLAFYVRETRRLGRAPADSEYQSLLKRYFPHGLNRVGIGELTGPPRAGLWVSNPYTWQKKAGFRDGDVVVAVDGIVVATREQWIVAYEASHEHDMRVIVWRGGEYLEIVAPFRRYQYRLDVRPYTPPATNAGASARQSGG